MSTTDKKERVYWTEEEREALSRQSFELYMADPNEKDHVLIDRAQRQIFAPERHRTIHSVKVVPFVKTAWIRYLLMLKQNTELPPVPPEYVPPAPPPVVEPEPETPPLIQQNWDAGLEPQVESAPTPEPEAKEAAPDFVTELMNRMSTSMLGSLLTHESVKTLIREVATEVATQLAHQIVEQRVTGMVLIPRKTENDAGPDEEVNRTPKHDPEQRGSDRVTYRKVLILGLSNAQEQLIMHEFPGINFFFLHGSEGKKRLEQTHQASELTIRTPWVKGVLPSTKNWRNFVNVSGMDGIRLQLKEKFSMIPLR